MIDKIIIGLVASILFYVLLHIAELTANKFYCDAEIEHDILAIRAPFIIFFILCILLPILFKSIAILIVFSTVTLMFLSLEEIKCKH
jgi:hypothetical protein